MLNKNMLEKRKKLKLFGFSVCLIFILSLVSSFVGAASLSIYPENPSVSQGESFNVIVEVSDVVGTELYGFQFDIEYDSSFLTYNRIIPGDFLSEGGVVGVDYSGPRTSIGNLEDYRAVRYQTKAGVTGSGVLATIQFTANDQLGDAYLRIAEDQYFDGLLDTSLNWIDHDITQGPVTIGPAQCSLDNAYWNPTQRNVGMVVDLNIDSSTVQCADGEIVDIVVYNLAGEPQLSPGDKRGVFEKIGDFFVGLFGGDVSLSPPAEAVFGASGVATETWTTESVGEFYFVASLRSAPSVEISSLGRTDGTLTVLEGCVNSDGDPYFACDVTGAPISGCGTLCDCDDGDINNYPGNVESCDGADNNCDNVADDGFTEEQCSFVCEEGNYDFNPARGTDLKCCGDNTGENNPFETTETRCDGSDNDCNGFVDEVTLVDPNNCGSCGNVCNLPSVSVHDCINSGCEIVTCDSGWTDLDGVVSNGCEYECAVTNGGVETCDGLDNNCNGQTDEGFTAEDCLETCVVDGGKDFNPARGTDLKCCGNDQFEDNPFEVTEQSCDGNDNDCDGQTDEMKDSDPANCGSCGNVCNLLHTDTHNCVSGGCGVVVCVSGWHDLDGDSSNGCEHRCEVTNGGVETCDGLDNNCDGQFDEGFGPEDCEAQCLVEGGENFDLARGIDLKCCGNDQFEDNPFEVTEQSCDGNDNDCDGQTDEMKDSDPDNCGSCGNVCNLPSVGVHDCINSGCEIVTCDSGWTDLDGDASNGCEYECAPSGANEICDGVDNNCNGQTDEGFNAEDCLETCLVAGGENFNPARGTDLKCCGNDQFENNPFETTETRCDGSDNDCNGVIDESDAGCFGPTPFCSAGSCVQCVDAGQCPADYYGNNYCHNGDVYRDLFDYFCAGNNVCAYSQIQDTEPVETCEFGCAGGVCIGDPCGSVTCGTCERCVGGGCVADASKNGQSCDAGTGTCDAGVCVPVDNCVASSCDSQCQTCNPDDGRCEAVDDGTVCDGGQCIGGSCVCVADCSGKVCGDDGCGGSCLPGCDTGYSCDALGQCIVDCVPDTCTSLGKQCGTWPNGCGVDLTCPTCPTGQSCDALGQCIVDCVPDTCTSLGKQCGTWPNGCGVDLTCPTCPTGQSCSDGQCIVDCVPDCAGKTCGSDGCDEDCGTCGPGDFCDGTGNCEPIPVEACEVVSASWSSSEVDEGTEVTLNVGGDGDCETGDVVNIQIFEADRGDDGNSDDSVESLSTTFSGTTATVTWTAEYRDDNSFGERDPPEYYFIASSEGSGMQSGDLIVNQVNRRTRSVSIQIEQGYNFIQFPLVLDSYEFGDVFSAEQLIKTKAIYEYDPSEGWLPYYPNLPTELSSLSELSFGKGYIIYADEAYTLTLNGYRKNSDLSLPSVPLIVGWNLFSSFSRRIQLGKLIEGLEEGVDYNSVWGFNRATGGYYQIGVDDFLEEDESYWIHMLGDRAIRPITGE